MKKARLFICTMMVVLCGSLVSFGAYCASIISVNITGNLDILPSQEQSDVGYSVSFAGSKDTAPHGFNLYINDELQGYYSSVRLNGTYNDVKTILVEVVANPENAAIKFTDKDTGEVFSVVTGTLVINITKDTDFSVSDSFK